MKVKKLTKKEKKLKKEFHIKFLKDNLEHKKDVYETYIEALVKYNIKNVAYAAIKSEELFQRELMRKMENCRDNQKSFCDFMFGKKYDSEEEKIEANIDYYDKLIKQAQWKIANCEDSIKTKIAKDAVEKGYLWLKLSSENYSDENPKRKSKKKTKKVKK